MARYFNNCRTAEDVKQVYKQLVKKLHPDNNPGTDTTKEFQEMQAEYRTAWDRLKNKHVNADGEAYEKATDETADEYIDLINRLFGLDGIEIELCGSWLWITGNTKEHKDTLKEMGFKWACKKSAWYYHRDPWIRRTRKGGMPLDEIRMKYGSTRFKKYDDEADLITA